LKAKGIFIINPLQRYKSGLQGKALPPVPTEVDDIKGELLEKEAEFEDETRPLQGSGSKGSFVSLRRRIWKKDRCTVCKHVKRLVFVTIRRKSPVMNGMEK